MEEESLPDYTIGCQSKIVLPGTVLKVDYLSNKLYPIICEYPSLRWALVAYFAGNLLKMKNAAPPSDTFIY